MQVINLSQHKLTKYETELLQRGLSFVPTSRYNSFHWVKDINLFVRKIKWARFFENKDRERAHDLGLDQTDLVGLRILEELEEENEKVQGLGPFTDLKKKSKKYPPLDNTTHIDVFLELVIKELKELAVPKHGTTHNITRGELEALINLEKNKQLTFKPSDKGGNIVVMDYKKYREMCLDILKDSNCYRILAGDPTRSFLNDLQEILEWGLDRRVLSKEEYEFLLPKYPIVATFYGLPKVHKGLTPLRGRPIVSGINSLTQNVGVYLDKVLRDFVTSLPSYTRDTTDLLCKLEDIIVDDKTIIASIDVEALYSSIPHDAGIMAIEYYLETKGRQFYAHNQLIIQLLRFTLEHNFFLFDDRYFHQLRGTAMGSACAPTYANLLLGWWEATVVFTEEREEINQSILLWTRYIDDIFILWQGSESSFVKYVQNLNHNLIGLKFTYECNPFTLPFLDVLISKGAKGNLETKVYRKSTSTNSLLKWESCHPRSLVKGIPRGQFLRLRRNCSEVDIFRTQACDLKHRFIRRGYPQTVLDGAYKEALQKERKKLLIPKPKEVMGDSRQASMRIIGQYDSHAQEVRKILTKYWNILLLDEDIRKFIPSRPMIT